MPWAPNLKLGVDIPVWDWLSFFPAGNSNPGTGNAYDGVRYMYWAVQTGTTTAGTSSTTTLYRYDTWTDAWQFLATLTSTNQGLDVEYDPVRNVVYVLHGNALTSWQVFNLNTVAVTICGVVCNAWALTTMTPVLPIAGQLSGSFTLPEDLSVAATQDGGTATAGSTSTLIFDTAGASFGLGLVGLQVRFTSGALAGQSRTILSVQGPGQLTVGPAFTGAPGVGDAFVVEMVADVATAGAVGTLTDTKQTWAVNQYANMDVLITAGTGVGQRRRIASNTATVLTLAGAVTGNARTGNFGVAPDATSAYRIVPSSDFLYFQPGNASSALYKIDLVANPAAAWTALASAPAAAGGGANTVSPVNYAPYSILMLRGSATATYYVYDIGLNTWRTPTVLAGSETFTTGATMAMLHGKRRMMIQKEGSNRLYALDLTTGILEPFGTMPYAAPSTYDGHRARFVRTPDGVEWLYIMRASGAEFFRIAVEWLASVT